MKSEIQRGDRRSSREEAQEAQKGFHSLRFLRFFAAIQELCHCLRGLCICLFLALLFSTIHTHAAEPAPPLALLTAVQQVLDLASKARGAHRIR